MSDQRAQARPSTHVRAVAGSLRAQLTRRRSTIGGQPDPVVLIPTLFFFGTEPAPGLPSSVLAPSRQRRTGSPLARRARATAQVPLHRDPDGWSPIDDWASAELLSEPAGADFTHVRLGNRGHGAVAYETELTALRAPAATSRRHAP